jgi:hypothetical protein
MAQADYVHDLLKGLTWFEQLGFDQRGEISIRTERFVRGTDKTDEEIVETAKTMAVAFGYHHEG